METNRLRKAKAVKGRGVCLSCPDFDSWQVNNVRPVFRPKAVCNRKRKLRSGWKDLFELIGILAAVFVVWFLLCGFMAVL